MCKRIRIEAQRLFARTWMCVRGPSPPDEPALESVRVALMSCLTWRSR